MTLKIFVYGSLRTGMYNYEKYLEGRIVQSELAYVKGSLHEIKGVVYPALVEGEDMIAGEIMEIEDDSILPALDELEGWLGEGNPQNEYNKTMMNIYDDLGNLITKLPVYFFNMSNPLHQDILGDVITCKDYVKHVYEKQKLTQH